MQLYIYEKCHPISIGHMNNTHNSSKGLELGHVLIAIPQPCMENIELSKKVETWTCSHHHL